MLRICVRPAALLCRGACLLLFAALSSPLFSEAAPASSPSTVGSRSPWTTVHGDAAVTQAMQDVMAQLLWTTGDRCGDRSPDRNRAKENAVFNDWRFSPVFGMDCHLEH
jgi:hypothetical protein